MRFPRWRYLAVALFVVFILTLVALNFDALLAIQHWIMKAAALVAAVLALLKYVQEQLRVITDDFVHTMDERDVERSFWERVL